MAITAGEAVSKRTMAQLKILGAFLAKYSAFEAWAITTVLNAQSDSLLRTAIADRWDNMVVLPTVDAATPSGYQTEQALSYFENKNLLSDITDVLTAVRDYARAKELSKRGTRNLLRAVIRPEDRMLERIPDELMALTGPGKPKLKVPRFPFVERGMTIHDRFEFASQTAATSVEAWKVRQMAEREGADVRWVTMRDDKVRPAHVHAQGQTVAYDEPFSVGGYPMWFPGDPSAPEDLTINCRCVLTTVAPPNRRYVQRYIPAAWLNASVRPDLTASGGLPGMAPSQARAPKGTSIGGQWIDTPGAIRRSLNRLRHASDMSPDAAPTDLEAADAERTRLADEVLAREGRPGVQETADRLAAIYDRTTPEQRAAGEKWYDEASALAQEMADNPNTDLTQEQAGAILAHLSTQTRWEANADYARSLAAGMTQDEALAHLREGVLSGRVPRPKQGGDFIYDDNWNKALAASASDDPIGRGNLNLGTFSELNKTRTFAGNILGDEDGVTIDVWMQRLLGQSLLIPAGQPQLKFPDPKTGKLKVLSKKKREEQIYESMSQALRIAAKQKGISPREMQAITWGWGLANYKQAREGHPGRFIDGDLVLPDVIGGEQALIDSGDLVAAQVYMPEPRPLSLAEEPMPDYHYAQAEHLLGLPRQTAPEERTETPGDILASLVAAAPSQARAPKGVPIGGEWIETPGAVLDMVREQGGASIDPLSGLQPTDGYMVAVQGFNEEVPEEEFFGPGGADRLVAWMDRNQEALSQPGGHVGLWHDTANGEVVLDVSQRVDTVEEAVKLGGERNQQSIWDVAGGEEIPTGGTGDRQASAYRMEDYGRDTGPPSPRRAPPGLGGVGRGTQARLRAGDDRRAGPAGLSFASADQIRAPKGTPQGGQWIDTPGGMARQIRGVNLAVENLGKPVAEPVSYDDMDNDYTALVEKVNPGYLNDPNDEAYNMNCQRVVGAMEMRARGFDAAANAFDGTRDDTIAIENCWTDPQTGSVRLFSPEVPPNQARTVLTTSYPPGSRFIIGGYNKADQFGHVWNAEILPDGTILEVDGQGGTWQGYGTLMDDWDDIQWLRVDDLTPTEDMLGFVGGNYPMVVPPEDQRQRVGSRLTGAAEPIDPAEAGRAAGFDVIEVRDLGSEYHLIVANPVRKFSDSLLVMDKATGEVHYVSRFTHPSVQATAEQAVPEES